MASGGEFTISAADANVFQKITPVQQLHGKEPQVALGEQLIERNQIGVDNARNTAKFLLEEKQSRGTEVGQSLERNADAAILVLNLIHHAHAAFANLANQLKAR